MKESGLEETDPDLATKQTSQDFEDACNEEYANFKPAPRITGNKQTLVACLVFFNLFPIL